MQYAPSHSCPDTHYLHVSVLYIQAAVVKLDINIKS